MNMLRKIFSRTQKRNQVSDRVQAPSNYYQTKQRFSISWDILSYPRSKETDWTSEDEDDTITENAKTVVCRFSAYMAKLSREEASSLQLRKLDDIVVQAIKLSQVTGDNETNSFREKRRGSITYELQEGLHKKFQSGFEEICQDFLEKEGISISKFYSIKDNNTTTDCQGVSDEESRAVLKLIRHASSFEHWINSVSKNYCFTQY